MLVGWICEVGLDLRKEKDKLLINGKTITQQKTKQMNKLNLILHCGSSHATREKVASTKTPDPTDTWVPIPHISLLNEIEKAMGKNNLSIVNETFGLSPDGLRMFGLLQVANCKQSEDYSFVVGVRNRNDKLVRAGVCVGSGAFVCDNLAFSSEIRFDRKHTIFINRDLPLLIDTALGKLGEHWILQDTRIAKYKETEISLVQAKELVIDAATMEIFPRSKVMDVYDEFVTPRHPEFAQKTVWGFFNAVTENLKPGESSKGTTLWSLPSRTQRLHSICDMVCGIQLVKPSSEKK